MGKYYQIDEVAKLTQITKRTIRYYEDMELIKPARTDSSYRLYSEEDIEVIMEIRDLRLKIGLNLIEVKHILGLKKKLDAIVSENPKDLTYLEDTLNQLKDLMQIIEEREKILKKVKENGKRYLTNLEEKIAILKE